MTYTSPTKATILRIVDMVCILAFEASFDPRIHTASKNTLVATLVAIKQVCCSCLLLQVR